MTWSLDDTIEWAIGAVAVKPVNATAVKLSSLTATQEKNGVLVQWRTGWEVDNLGFHVYRQEGGQRIRLTPELIAGSAFLVGEGTALRAGHSYRWWDPEGSASARYWLQDIDLDGKRTWHGPVTPVPAQAGAKRSGQAVLFSRVEHQQALYSPLLSQLGKAESGEGAFVERAGPFYQSATSAEERRQRQWELASEPAVKLEVNETGWYRVEQPELVAAGLSPGVNPQFLQLFLEGEEQTMWVPGKGDGSFDSWDAIEFYGTGVDTPWTGTQTYWLVEGGEPGQRVAVSLPAIGQRAELESFPFTVERKERTIYFAALKNGEAENFFGPLVTNTPVEPVVSLRHLDSAKDEAQLEVSLQGVTQGPHQVKILLNAIEVGRVSFLGQELGTASFAVPMSWLQEGENVVTLAAEGGETDVCLVDVIRITYWHTYMADADILEFTVPVQPGTALGTSVQESLGFPAFPILGRQRVTVGGFSSPLIRLVDVTDPKQTRVLAGLVRQQGAGYAITVGVSGWGAPRTLLALTVAQVKPVAAIQANNPSVWHGADSGAEVLIITHQDFLASVEPLKALREAEGYSVAVVDVEDIYDEFAFGAKTPWALRDFLEWASEQWQTEPRFVLLVGDASFDPRNYLGLGNFDLVPTRLVETTFLETASDDWFADFDFDGVPELAVGRLPVRTPQEADTVVAKIVSYEQEQGSAWRQEVLLVADENQGSDFEQASAELKALLPVELTVWEIFRGQSGAGAKMELLTRLNQGQLLVNYLGHGSVEVWRGNLLTSEDARGLTNGSQLPFFVGLTCLNGFFHDLYTESLAEALLKADEGGAVAVWTSSGLTTPAGQLELTQELLRLLYGGQGLTVGEAVAKAKAAVIDPDVRRTWIFFGDPVMRLQ